MRLIQNEKIINILENTLNCIDKRLMGHGKRLAYLMFRVLRGEYERTALRDICLLAMLHDVGAYKTEEISDMYYFEVRKVWEHSIYGYLFLKYFSPLKHLAPAILHHHSPRHKTAALKNGELEMLAQLICLINTADMYSIHKRSDDNFRKYAENHRGKFYKDDIVEMFFAADIRIDAIERDMAEDTAFNELLYNTPLTACEAEGYVKAIVSSIDFRSGQTVIHTRAVSCVAQTLARLTNATQADIEKIKTAALLHDIGKISTPLHILESTGRLNDADMEIMRNHAVVTQEIITGNVDDEIKDIAVNHHEKPDGTGYPKGLTELSPLQRLMGVADVFSALCGARSYKDAYPKEKIVGILQNMAAKNHLDTALVTAAVQHYDEIINASEIETNKASEDYEAINNEYKNLLRELEVR